MREDNRRTTESEIIAMLKARRKTMNLTQQETACRAKLNLRHYQRFEYGGRSLVTASFTTTMNVLDALEINPDDFISQYVKNYGQPHGLSAGEAGEKK